MVFNGALGRTQPRANGLSVKSGGEPPLMLGISASWRCRMRSALWRTDLAICKHRATAEAVLTRSGKPAMPFDRAALSQAVAAHRRCRAHRCGAGQRVCPRPAAHRCWSGRRRGLWVTNRRWPARAAIHARCRHDAGGWPRSKLTPRGPWSRNEPMLWRGGDRGDSRFSMPSRWTPCPTPTPTSICARD